MQQQDLLIEIGCEELPPRSLKQLATAFNLALAQEFKNTDLLHHDIRSFATPRRLALIITNLIAEQPAKEIEKLGPALEQAYDADGNPTPACVGFARSCGIAVEQLQVKPTDKGQRVFYTLLQPGLKTVEILPKLIENALKKLPIPKAMRWGDHSYSFVRPVQWLIVLYGTDIVPCEIFGITSNNSTRGHRFLSTSTVNIPTPNQYVNLLEKQGSVIAEFDERKKIIIEQVSAAIEPEQHVIMDEALLDEVTALVEWPVVLKGRFPKEFLTVPKEVLICSMQTHQKCFPVEDNHGHLLPYFILVSNIKSKSPAVVIEGNERVINARLSDAAFFYAKDCKETLEKRLNRLDFIIFQKQLGSVGDKSRRLAKLSHVIATSIQADFSLAERAGLLSKCDLVTDMVSEFPSLQGIMGYHYALNDHESEAVAIALKEQYYPRYSGDQLPQTPLGCTVALADRLDSLIGIIGINQSPTGDKDPFGLRRMALGIIRISIENQLNLDLMQLLHQAKQNYSIGLPNENVVQEVYDFIMGRLKSWYVETQVSPETFEAVLAKKPTVLLDFHQRIQAVQQFETLAESRALAAANKRVANILRKQAEFELIPDQIQPALFEFAEEKQLAAELTALQQTVFSFYQKSDYASALSTIAQLKNPVDCFFDNVMVMVDDPKIRANRLALLKALHHLMTQVADIALLPS